MTGVFVCISIGVCAGYLFCGWLVYWGVMAVRNPDRVTEDTLAYRMMVFDIRHFRPATSELTRERKREWGLVWAVSGLVGAAGLTLKVLALLI